jgi:hypothetical protein
MTGIWPVFRNHRRSDEYPAGISFGRAGGNDMMPIQMIPATPGDAPPATFDELFARHRRAIHRFCYRMVASYTDAEDLVQEAMMRAWKARDSYDPASRTTRASTS